MQKGNQMNANRINTVTVTTKGKTKHGVEFTLVDVRKHADVPADVLASLAEGKENEGYKWHAPQTKSEVGYFWKGFATEKEAKADAKRLQAYMRKPAKADAPAKANAKSPKAKKTETVQAKPDLKALIAGLSPEEKLELLVALCR